MRYYFLFNLFGLPLTKEPLTIIVLIGLLATILKIIADITGLWQKWTAGWKDYREQKRLRQRLGAELYTPEDIIKHRKYYIQPQCQDVDPSQEVDIRKVHAVTSDLFEYVDKLLTQPDVHKYSIILADSGMGKTSFVVNYWYRYWRDKKRRAQYNLAMVPLGQGKKKVDAFINKLPEKHNTVLFLDAFDEDSQAIEDHQKRLTELLELATDFKQIFITCNTQFFRFQEEIPGKTGVLVIGLKDLKGGGSYEFKKLYLTPFSDEQVNAYLKRYFGRWQRKKREQARQLVDKIPYLTVRPMILTYIPDLVESNKYFKYPFQLYEEIVQKWLEREKPFIPDTRTLRQFSEYLAVDLYAQKGVRGGERVHYKDLLPLTQRMDFPLQDWQIRGRSLLNRDAEGNYKFAHRSIMEFLFVKRFLVIPAKERPRLKWTDQMEKFLEELLDDCTEKRQNLPDVSGIDLQKYHFRDKFATLTDEQVLSMLQKYNFFDSRRNKSGQGVKHRYFVTGDKEKVIQDLTTGLMWQQGGSPDWLNWKDVQKWIDDLKRKGYAGYHDWRLPTLEEAMSLMEPKKLNGDLYIDPVFDNTQRWIWTADLVAGGSLRWVVYFYSGLCFDFNIFHDDDSVRLVRSGLSSTGE